MISYIVRYLLPLCLLLASTQSALARQGWTDIPMLVAERIKGADRRSQSGFRAVNLITTEVIEFPPSKSVSTPRTLATTDDGLFLMKTGGRGDGNYHWVQAQSTDGMRFASTVHYFSNPGPAPRRLLRQDKLELEIRPVDLPREHRRFRANESWDFQVMKAGSALADATVVLETSNGSNQRLTTDQQGIVTVKFPDDFASADDPHKHHRQHVQIASQGGGGHAGHRRRSAKFVVSVSHNGMISAFNYKYSPDAYTNKAVLPAVGLLFGGSLITGFALMRRRSA